jgi:hypothetical protein
MTRKYNLEVPQALLDRYSDYHLRWASDNYGDDEKSSLLAGWVQALDFDGNAVVKTGGNGQPTMRLIALDKKQRQADVNAAQVRIDQTEDLIYGPGGQRAALLRSEGRQLSSLDTLDVKIPVILWAVHKYGHFEFRPLSKTQVDSSMWEPIEWSRLPLRNYVPSAADNNTCFFFGYATVLCPEQFLGKDFDRFFVRMEHKIIDPALSGTPYSEIW